MSKSTSMLPSLAGDSGVAAHTLTDADLMKVVDAATLNANRDRKMTLAELKSYIGISAETERAIAAENGLDTRLDALEPIGSFYTGFVAAQDIGTAGQEYIIAQSVPPAVSPLSYGTWMLLLQVTVRVNWIGGGLGSADGELGLRIRLTNNKTKAQMGSAAYGMRISVSDQLPTMRYTKNLITYFPVNSITGTDYNVFLKTDTGAFSSNISLYLENSGQVIFRKLSN